MATTCEPLDPRVRRTRRMLQDALQKTLERKDFDKISVQDITDVAQVNRATFYDHFADKFALLECMVGSSFHELLAERKVQFDGTCSSGLKPIILGICDFLVQMQGRDCQKHFQPHMESAIISVIRKMLLNGLENAPGEVSAETRAATASWAIYGAVKEWAQTPNRSSPEEMTELITRLVLPILHS